MTPADIERMAVAWIMRHRDDGPDTRPAVYFTAAEAEAHAAQFLPGVATVVALGDVAAVRAQALDDAARVAAATVCDTHLPTGVRIYGTRAAAAIRAIPTSAG